MQSAVCSRHGMTAAENNMMERPYPAINDAHGHRIYEVYQSWITISWGRSINPGMIRQEGPPCEERMQKPNLTKKQRALVAELRDLMARLRLDADQIVEKAQPGARTTYLELAKDQIIRSAVILKYVLMDEHLSAAICWYYFGKKARFSPALEDKTFQDV